jgi:uncharacterized membrane protein YphA (DoxX/SURF4 family)
MLTTTTMPSSAVVHPDEAHTLHVVQTTLKLTFGIVPIVAGFDKFTNVLTSWTQYLNPIILDLLPFTAVTFMAIVGVIEILAGILVFIRPRIGGWIVAAWLTAIALQLLIGWMYVDIAVRDLVMAIGALTLARLTPLADRHSDERAVASA